MIPTGVVCIFLVVLWIVKVEPTHITCRGGIPVIQSGPEKCFDAYLQSGAFIHFNVSSSSCNLFSSLNFTVIQPHDNWPFYFNSCAHDPSLLLNALLPGGGFSWAIELLSTHCHYYDGESGSNNATCLCKMDCLLTFELGPFSYIFLKGITCNQSVFNSTISIFRISTNIQSFWADDSSCFIPSSSSINSIILFYTSSNVIVSSSDVFPSSSLTNVINVSPTPTETNIPSILYVPSILCLAGSKFNVSSTNYCSISCSISNELFLQLFNESCQPYITSYFIKLIEDSPDNQCSSTILGDILNAATIECNNDWTITAISCQCSMTNCPIISDSLHCDTISCFIMLTYKPNNTSLYILFTELTSQVKNELLTNITNCNSDTLMSSYIESDCCSSTSGVVVKSSVPVIPFHETLTFTLVISILSVIIILVAVILFSSICIVLIIKKRRLPKQFKSTATGVNIHAVNSSTSSTIAVDDSVNSTVLTRETSMIGFDYTKWKLVFSKCLIDVSQLTVLETIGEGAFGCVRKGTLLQSGRTQLVAIKSLKDASTTKQIEEFLSESVIMLDFDHPNILQLFGVCFDKETPFIVLPYMVNGDLKKFLVRKRRTKEPDTLPEDLSMNDLMEMCTDIARGMTYLADLRFVHRDLAARNCMVDDKLLVKVADFGLSRDVYSSDYYRLERRAKLPVKWLPPESLHDNIYNEKTDVWSFGVVIWEIFSLGRQPYPGVDNADIPIYISTGNRLRQPVLCPVEIYHLMNYCWKRSPNERPTFSWLLEQLDKIKSNKGTVSYMTVLETRDVLVQDINTLHHNDSTTIYY